MKKRSLFILVLISVFFLLMGCRAKEEENTEDEIREAAETIVETVSQHLAAANQENASIGLTDEQLEFLKSSQLAEMLAYNPESPEETGKMALGILKGTLLALGSYAEDPDAVGDEANDAVGSKVEIIKTVSLELLGVLQASLDPQSFLNYTEELFEEAVSYLDSAGITQTDAIEAIEELATGVLAYAGELELPPVAIAAIATALTENAVESLGSDGAGLLGKLVPQAAESILPAIMEGMKEAGMSAGEIALAASDIIEAAVVGLGEVPGLKAEDLALSVKAVEEGLTEGLEQIGLSNDQISDLEDAIDSAMNAAVEKLAEESEAVSLVEGALTMSPEAVADLVDEMASGLLSVDSETGLELSEEQVNGVEEAIKNALESADDNKLETVAELAFEAAKSAISDIVPPLSEDEKVDALKNIAETSVVFLSGKVVDEPMGDSNLSDALQAISDKAMDNLFTDMTGDPEVFADIAAALIEPLNVMPMGNTSIADAARGVVEDMVSAIGETGMSKAEQNAALSNALSGALEAVQSGQTTLDELKEAEGSIAAGAIESLLENQKDKLEDFLKDGDVAAAGAILDEAVGDILDAMKEAGALDTPGLADDILDGAFDALTGDGGLGGGEDALTPNQVADALDEAAEKVKEALEEEALADDVIDEEEQEAIDDAAEEMAKKGDELLSGMAPFGTPNLALAAETANTMEGAEQGMPIGVALDAQPEEDFVITIESKNTAEGTVEPSTITFTPDNWIEAREVMIISQDDWVIDGDVEYQIVLSTDIGIRKTVTVTNADNDVADLDIEPFGEKRYLVAAGGSATYKVRLKTIPADTITVYWALDVPQVDDADPLSITKGRTMVFEPSKWNHFQELVVTPANIDLSEKSGGSVYTASIEPGNDSHYSYENIKERTMPMVLLKSLRIKQIEKAGSQAIKVAFDGTWNEDEVLLYEKKIFEGQSITLKPAENQVEPVCASVTPDLIIEYDELTGLIPISGSIGIAAFFSNTTLDSAKYAMEKLIGNTDFSFEGCSGIFPLPKCTFSFELDVSVLASAIADPMSVVPDLTLEMNSIFNNSGVGNTMSCSILGGTPSAPGSATGSLSFEYDSIVAGSAQAIFKTNESPSGYWMLDGLSSALSRSSEPYGPEHYVYVKF